MAEMCGQILSGNDNHSISEAAVTHLRPPVFQAPIIGNAVPLAALQTVLLLIICKPKKVAGKPFLEWPTFVPRCVSERLSI